MTMVVEVTVQFDEKEYGVDSRSDAEGVAKALAIRELNKDHDANVRYLEYI